MIKTPSKMKLAKGFVPFPSSSLPLPLPLQKVRNPLEQSGIVYKKKGCMKSRNYEETQVLPACHFVGMA